MNNFMLWSFLLCIEECSLNHNDLEIINNPNPLGILEVVLTKHVVR